MTPSEINEYARQQYNAVGDTFYTDAELYRHIFAAELELAMKAGCIKNVYTTSTVVSTQEYSRPSGAIIIKRISYEGTKLAPISMREDDAITLMNQATTQTGTPQFYYEWGASFFLRPVPDAVGTLKIYSVDKPQPVTATSVLDVPDRYHDKIADYLLERMARKDKNYGGAKEFAASWADTVLEAIRHERRRLRGDQFTGIQDDAALAENVIGSI